MYITYYAQTATTNIIAFGILTMIGVGNLTVQNNNYFTAFQSVRNVSK